jgi:transposase
VPDEVCLRGLLIRLVTGSSWVDIEALLDHQVSDTTLRGRRDEWIDAGVFDALMAEALAAYDRILELDLDVVALDGSIHKAPGGGEGTGKSPVDRGKLGWKWSVAVDRAGIPIGWSIDGANRNDVVMVDPTLDAVEAIGLIEDIGTLSLDRGYDYPAVRARLEDRGLTDLDIQRRGTKPKPGTPHRLTLGLRWIVEATNTWWSNYGQLRRSTDRRNHHRHAALRLATAVLIIGRLLDYRDRWSRPI